MQHSCSHYNAFCSIPWQTCTYLRTWQHQMTTIMQPFQCYLQPEIQEPNRTTHTDTTTRCRTQRRNRSRPERPQPQPPLSSPAAATLHGKTQGFVLQLPLQNKAHASFMHPHHFPSSSLPLSHHFPSSPLPFVTTSHRHHFPSSPLPIVTTSLPHHFPSSPLVS